MYIKIITVYILLLSSLLSLSFSRRKSLRAMGRISVRMPSCVDHVISMVRTYIMKR